MHLALIALAAVAAAVLIHVAYVDFRFRYREGVAWFWLLKPAPPLMWVGRALMVATVVLAAAIFFIGTDTPVLVALGVLMGLHIISVVLLEVLEPR